jgi:hypothetical protein
VFDEEIEEEAEILTAKVLEFESFRRDGALIDAGKSLKQLTTPLVNMLKGDVTLERMNHSLHEVDALLWIRQARSKHLAFTDLTSPFGFCPS